MFPMMAPRSRPLADRSRRLLHHLADDTDDRHQHPATDPAARDAGQDRADVQPARRRAPAADPEQAQELAAEPAAEDAGDRVAERPEVEILEQGSRDVAPGRTAD